MLGRKPWTWRKRGLAVNEPETEWFNAVTTALATFGVRFGNDETAYVERINPDGSQWNVVLPRSLASSEGGLTGKHHFKIEPKGPTAIKVLGGSRIRDTAENDTRVPLTGDAGLAATVDLFKSVTIAASVYVWIEFDDALNPASLTVNTGAAYPTPDVDSEKLVLGYVTFAGGEITDIEQYWTGGDWRDQWSKYDGASLGYNAAAESQVYGFALAVSEIIDNYALDLILYKDENSGRMKYTSLADLSGAIIGYWDSIPAYPFAWSDLSDTIGDPTNAIYEGYIPIVKDQGASVYRLELLNGGPGGSGPWWKLGNTIPADAYGQVIGNPSQLIVIDLLNQRLTNTGGATWTLDWAARQFDGADWTALLGTILKSNDTTVAASGDGALEIANGGAYLGAGLYSDKGGSAQAGYFADVANIAILCDGTNAVACNDAVASAYLCDGTQAGRFIRGTNVLYAADATYAANAVGGGINVNNASAYYHGDDQGQTATDGGNELFGGGIFKNEANWVFFTIQTVVPGSGVKQLRVLALDVT